MSSFDGRSHIYLFDLKNGKKKLAYGKTPEEALEILAMRLDQPAMDEILRDSYRVVRQKDLQGLVGSLG